MNLICSIWIFDLLLKRNVACYRYPIIYGVWKKSHFALVFIFFLIHDIISPVYVFICLRNKSFWAYDWLNTMFYDWCSHRFVFSQSSFQIVIIWSATYIRFQNQMAKYPSISYISDLTDILCRNLVYTTGMGFLLLYSCRIVAHRNHHSICTIRIGDSMNKEVYEPKK